MLSFRLLALSLNVWVPPALAIYNPVRAYEGPTFFDGWDFYDNVDNTTWGNNTYLNQAAATSQGMAYVDQNTNRAIIRVDNITNVPGPTAQVPYVHRNSVRITTKSSYDIGSLVIVDISHLPYGCSVWPSFWTLGEGVEWPGGGEIDVIETINLMQTNQMALHTKDGCFQTVVPGAQLGTTSETNCSTDRGCTVSETKANPVGQNFANAGGGVWAVQIDISGVFIWFWSRPDIPPSIKNADTKTSLELTDWGLPSAAYPSSNCTWSNFFLPQKLIFNIALCGTWAGIPDLYSSTCHTATNSCVNDNIIGVGSPTYDQAYFEINYVRTYIVGNGTAGQTSSPVSTYTVPTTGSPTSGSPSASSTDPFTSNSVIRKTPEVLTGTLALALFSFFI